MSHRVARRSVLLVAVPATCIVLGLAMLGSFGSLAGRGPGEPAAHRVSEAGIDAVLRGCRPAAGARAALRGRVVRSDGLPVHRAWIYLVRKEGPRDVAPCRVTRSEAEGRWSLGTVDPTGYWIASVADGLAPSFLDGDVWQGEPLTIRLDAGRSLTVRVEPSGLLVGGAVRLVCTSTDGFTTDWPRPGTCRPFRLDVPFGLRDEIVVQAPTEGPVHLCLEGSGVRGQPAEQDVSPPDDTAWFALRTSCLLDVRATDAETGWNLEMRARAALPGFVIEEPPHEPFRLEDIDVHHLMDTMYRWGLPCGRYHLRVWCDGYLPFAARDIDLEQPGARVVVQAALQVDPALGMLDVTVVVDGETGLGDRAPHIVVRRLDGEVGTDPDWAWGRPRTLDRGAGRARIGPLHPGSYEVYVWADADLVGRSTADVVGGRSAEVRIPVAPGVMVDLLRGAALDPGRYCEWTDVRLLGRRGEPLPPVRFGCHQPPARVHRGDTGPDGVSAGGTVPLDAVLGPLPVDEVVVTTDPGESPRSWVVRAGDE